MSHLQDAEEPHGVACTQARGMKALSVGAGCTQLLYRKDAPVPTGSQEVMLATKSWTMLAISMWVACVGCP